MFADAVHPTHAVRPVGCWAPKETKVAVDQTSGRKRMNIHGAIEALGLETGQTRIREVLTVDAMSTIALLMSIEALYPAMRLIHVFGQRPLSSRQACPRLAGPAGAAHKAPFRPALLSAFEPYRASVGADAQKRHPQPMLRHFQRILRRHARVPERGCSQKLGRFMRRRIRQFPRHITKGFSGSDVSRVYFKYPADIRRVIYTTNAIEAVHRQFRKLTKTKGAFPNENSLLKLLYMGIQNASKKWTMPLQNWNLTLSQLSIYFEGRLDDVLDI